MANVSIQSPEPPVDLLPSHIAAVKNDVQKLSNFVEEGAPLEDPTNKETPLHAAAKVGSLDTLRWLLGNNTVAPEARSSSGYTAAHWAAVYGHFECLKLLLTHDPTKEKELAAIGDEGGLTVLSLATLQGDKAMVSWLLEHFPEISHKANSNGDQIVHFAAAEGHLDILKMLVEKFGEEIVSRKDNRSTNPVFFAAQQGKLDVLNYLVSDLGQDPVAKDKDGMITLHAAIQNEMTSTVKWLIGKMGPKYILEKTIDGATPLHMAAASGNTEILKFLLDNLEDSKDVNVTDNINATPAHDAAEYGKIKTMLLLLKHGADINITDTEGKTPYQLAVEQNHTSVAAMLADYRDNGPTALQAYEKRRARPSKDEKGPRTSRQEAEELSSAIVQSAETLDNYKEKQLKRQESLSKMNEVGADNDISTKKKQQQKNRSKDQGMSPQRSDEEDIEHELGPKGGIYAVPSKKGQGRQRSKGGRSHQNSDVEDFMSETMSHRSYNAANRGYHYRGGSYDEDPPYAMVNHDTASNYSRPSRVKRYQDTDSELSGLTGRSDYLYDGRGGFYPPGYNPMYPPSLPPARGKKIKRPGSASSKGSHPSSSQYRGHPPMGMPPAQYGHPMFYGYPQMYPGYPAHGQHGGMMMSAQQHQAMMRGYGPQGGPVYMAHPMQMQQLREQQQQSRRKSLIDKKKTKKLSTENKPSPRKLHTDQDIGYGPALDTTDSGNNVLEPKYDDDFHPPAPPISGREGKMEATSEVLKFDSNFLMARPGETSEVRHHAGTALNPAKAKLKPYDGRYDQYIMTDSEEEYEVDEYHKVGFAAEVACILAIGCVAGLKGLSKMRRGKPSLPTPKPAATADKPSLSTAWDVSYTDAEPTPTKKKKGGKRSRRNSISEIDSSITKDMSPEVFAGREEVERSTWAKSNQKKQSKAEEEKKKKRADPEEPQSELLTAELQKQSHQSVSKALGEKLLYDTIGARHSSMLNIASSNMGSRMSLASSADEANDDDDFGDAISMVHGLPPANPTKRKHLAPDPASVDIEAGDTEQLLSENKQKKKKKSKDKKDKDKKNKKEKKEKAKKDAGEEEEAEVIENTAALSAGENTGENSETEARQGEVRVEGEGASTDEKSEKEKKKEEKREKELREKERRDKEREEHEKERKERELKEKEKREKEKEDHEKEKRDKELKEKEKREEREQKEKEKKEKELQEKERREQEKKEKEQRDKEKKADERNERELKERERKEREKEQKEKEKREKEERREAKEKERREKEQKEKEQKERAKKEKEEKREKEKQEKEQREREKREQRERAAKEKAASTPARPAPPPPSKTSDVNANNKKKSTESSKIVKSPAEASQAKPALKATPPNHVRAELEAEGRDEAREVENKVYMFDTESEDEEEGRGADVSLVNRQRKKGTASDPKVDEIEKSMKTMADDLNSFLEGPFPTTKTQTAAQKTSKTVAVAPKAGTSRTTTVPPDVGIKEDETKTTRGASGGGVQQMVGESREEVKSEHVEESNYGGGDMQFGFGDDISAMAEEMHNFYQEEDLYTYMEGSTPSLDQASYTGIPGEDEDEKLVLVTKDELERKLENLQASEASHGDASVQGTTMDSATQHHGRRGDLVEMSTQSGEGRRSTHSIGIGQSVAMSEAGIQSTPHQQMHSTQGSTGYTEAFEQNVMNTLQALNDKMAQMKSNPTVTQQEINQQQQLQNEMIQSMISMSLNDPEVMKNLLSMLQQQLTSADSRQRSRRSSTAMEELQTKLLLAQEEQRQETKQHFQTQADFQAAMRKQLEEQSRTQMMGIQTNFELYAKRLEEQLAEQQKRWDAEMRKREEGKLEKKRKKSREKRHKKHRRQRQNQVESSESSSSESDEGLMMAASKSNKPKTVKFPAIKTMQAKILTQNLLDDEDDMKTESQVSIAKIKEKQQARGKLVRQDTSMKFDNARAAIRRYESKDIVPVSEDEDDDDKEEMIVQQIRPVTLKRAEIKTQSGTGYTPARPEPAPSGGRVGRIRRIESGSEAEYQQQQESHSTEGAGNELEAVLKKRQRK